MELGEFKKKSLIRSEGCGGWACLSVRSGGPWTERRKKGLLEMDNNQKLTIILHRIHFSLTLLLYSIYAK
jgi:hypothetical protein